MVQIKFHLTLKAQQGNLIIITEQTGHGKSEGSDHFDATSAKKLQFFFINAMMNI